MSSKANPRYAVVETRRGHKVWDYWRLETAVEPTTKKEAEKAARKLNAQ